MSSENGLRERLLRTRSIDALIAASQGPERRLRKTLGPWSLIGLGVGAVIGSGIFIVSRRRLSQATAKGELQKPCQCKKISSVSDLASRAPARRRAESAIATPQLGK